MPDRSTPAPAPAADRSDPTPDTGPSPAPSGPRWITIAIVALIAVRIVAAIVLANAGIQHDDNILGGDGRRYDEISNSQGTPYRDFEVEYPPVTLALIKATHGHDRLATLTGLIISQLALDLACVGVLWWAWSKRTALAYLVLSAPLVFFPFLYVRIDLLSVFLATLGLGLVRRGLERSGGLALAVSVFAKVWPAVLAPVLLIERKAKATVTWVIGVIVGGVAWVAWVGPTGPDQVLSFRGAKGWQIESLPGIWFHMTDAQRSHVESGAWRTFATMPGWSRPVLTALSLATVVAAWGLAARRRRAGDDDSVVYGAAPLVCVLALLVFAPILSPQYILWLLPWAAIVAASGNRVQAGLTLAVTALTTWIFATIHAQVDGRWYAVGPVVVRNALLVIMLVVGLVQLARPAPVTAEPAGLADAPEVRATASPSS